MREFLVESLTVSIEVRWQELTALETALAEFEQELGEPATHPEVRAKLDRVRRTIISFYEALGPLAPPFSLPEPAEEHLKVMRENIDTTAVRNATTAAVQADPRKWMRDDEREALEELERQWANEVRGDA